MNVLNFISDNDFSHSGIKGMRWGVRRYQNADGSLTELGKKRYANATTGFDANKEAKKDLDSTNTILREGGSAARTASSAIRNIPVKAKRMDLSKMTDKEMRDRIAREQLESQYDNMFNTKRNSIESGKQTVSTILDGIGAITTVTASSLAIALAIKQLKG